MRVTGTGFQPGSAPDVWLAWCPQEVGGEEVFLPAGEALLGCDVPDEGRPRTRGGGDGPSPPTLVVDEDGYDVDVDGGFTIERFPLPETDAELAGRRCAARPGNCSFVWSHPNQFHQAALPPDQDLPLDLSG